jgi:hypothetical protein
MHGDYRPKRWAAIFVVALVAFVGIGVGLVAYNMGVAQGLAIGAHAAPVEQDARVAMQHYGYYGWHPWGFGFGGFGFFIPFLFFGFWFFALRLLFWGGPWRRHGYGRYGRWDRYGDGPRDLPPGFEEWHRRAHDRMGGDPTAPTAHV